MTVELENVGTGIMPVEVAATHGERFAKDGSPDPDYRKARTTVTLGKGESRDVVIHARSSPNGSSSIPTPKSFSFGAITP